MGHLAPKSTVRKYHVYLLLEREIKFAAQRDLQQAVS
jgi:hypothetical protein